MAVSHSEVRRKLARVADDDALVECIGLERRARSRLDHRHVLVEVVGLVEPGVRLVEVHHAYLDHAGSPHAKCEAIGAEPLMPRQDLRCPTSPRPTVRLI
jgi:hypothetical protein